MTPERTPMTPAQAAIAEQLRAQLDAIEAELRRMGRWDENPPDLQAEVQAGRLRSYLDAPSFELWLQGIFLPNARQRLEENDLPESSAVGEMARRQYDYHSFDPEAAGLLELLRGFDDLIARFHGAPGQERVAVKEPSAVSAAAAETTSMPAAMEGQVAPMFAQMRGLLLHWLDLTEDQLKRMDWWDPEPGETAPAFAVWLRDTVIPEARASIATGIVPPAAGVAAETRRRAMAEGLLLPEEDLRILAEFDEGVANYHSSWQLCQLPEPVPQPGALCTPPEYRGERLRLDLVRGRRKRLPRGVWNRGDFEFILTELRMKLLWRLDRISQALQALPDEAPQPASGDTPLEHWLRHVFLADVRGWIAAGQVPSESHIGKHAMEEYAGRGLTEEARELTGELMVFDAEVMAFQKAKVSLPEETAGFRLGEAWKLIKADPVLEMPQAPELDDVRRQMMLLLNRAEAELHMLGIYEASPPPLTATMAGTLRYEPPDPEVETPAPFPRWLRLSFLPVMRERIQRSDLPPECHIRDDANRILTMEMLGREQFNESRRLYNTLADFETLVAGVYPQTVQQMMQKLRYRGLVPPGQKMAVRSAAAEKFDEYTGLVREALRGAVYELKDLGWWGRPGENQAGGEGLLPPFEDWLRSGYFPELRRRLAEGRMLEERRISDYAAWECRRLDLLKVAKPLLEHLERLDHWSTQANRARREMLTPG